MARYRKIDCRIWNDAKFRELSDNGKLAFFFLLTHPHMTALGAFRGTIAGLAEELGWKLEAFREAFQEGCAKGMIDLDSRACLISLPNFLKYNPPESPNVVKAWAAALDLLPECRLKSVVIQRAKAFTEGMTEAFAKAFQETLPKAMPYQEQEQEPEQEQEKETSREPKSGSCSTSPVRKKNNFKIALPDAFGISDAVREWAASHGHTRLEERLEHFRGYAIANGKTYADWDQAFQNAIREDWANLNSDGRNGNGQTREERSNAAIDRAYEELEKKLQTSAVAAD